nr:MAG: ABC transporter ATP-binding protein [Bacillota bacterium]
MPVTGAPLTSPMIELRDVVKVYHTNAGPYAALKGVSLTVAPGEFVAVVGRSGSGKSTLVNIITGIDSPTAGEVWVAGQRVDAMSEKEKTRFRGAQVGVVFQFFQLIPNLTALENVLLPMDFCGKIPPRQRRERAMHLLEQVGLAGMAHKFPAMLSGGQQQRVAIARGLANDPPLLVADEPTGSLDSATADAIFELFERLVADGKTVVMVTHDQELARRVDRAVVVSDGRIVDEIVHRKAGGRRAREVTHG